MFIHANTWPVFLLLGVNPIGSAATMGLIWRCGAATESSDENWCCDDGGHGISCCSSGANISLRANFKIIKRLLGVPTNVISTTSTVKSTQTHTTQGTSVTSSSSRRLGDINPSAISAIPVPTTTQITTSLSSLIAGGRVTIGVSIPLAILLAVVVGVSWWQIRQLKRKIMRLSSNYAPPIPNQQGFRQELHGEFIIPELSADRR